MFSIEAKKILEETRKKISLQVAIIKIINKISKPNKFKDLNEKKSIPNNNTIKIQK